MASERGKGLWLLFPHRIDVPTDTVNGLWLEADRAPFPLRGIGVTGDELLDVFEDDAEVLVVFFLEGLDLYCAERGQSIRRRSWTKVRMMEMLTSTALFERRTLKSIAAFSEITIRARHGGVQAPISISPV